MALRLSLLPAVSEQFLRNLKQSAGSCCSKYARACSLDMDVLAALTWVCSRVLQTMSLSCVHVELLL